MHIELKRLAQEVVKARHSHGDTRFIEVRAKLESLARV